MQNPPKPAVRPREDAFINAMPAYLGGSDRVGIKWVSGFEQSRAKGLPYIYGVFVLTDAETGRPLALIDGGWITEMRTAGVSGVVMRHVPDEASRARDRRGRGARPTSSGVVARAASRHRAGEVFDAVPTPRERYSRLPVTVRASSRPTPATRSMAPTSS